MWGVYFPFNITLHRIPQINVPAFKASVSHNSVNVIFHLTLKCDFFENYVKLKFVSRHLHGTPETPSWNHVTNADDYIKF